MTDVVVLVEKESDWRPEFPEVRLATARQYLTESTYAGDSGLLVINLCRSQQYQSTGYYCSLLAEARGHRVIPSVRTGQDLRRPAAFTPRYGLDASVRRFLRGLEGDRFKLDVLFGVTTEPAFEDLAREVFDAFRTPLVRIELARGPVAAAPGDHAVVAAAAGQRPPLDAGKPAPFGRAGGA